MRNFDCPHCHKVFDAGPDADEMILCPHCNGAVSLPEKDLPPGTMVAGYEVVSLIGHGGMGNVYLANQISMRRLVALKILLKSLTEDKTAVEQFLNEARISGQLSHRNIITALDAGESDGIYYLVTAYVDGDDLEKRLAREGTMAEPEALAIILKIGDALRYAWENHGMLHKDIKPGNIIVDSKNEPFLMDMGIAQFIGDHQKKETHIFGSPFYMSPEQTTGHPLYWTSDLYSLGATLYHMIVGVPPYDAPEVMDIIEMHSSAPFPEPAERNPDARVSQATTNLLRRMLAKKPPQRHCSWHEFLEEAKMALHGDSPGRSATKKKTPKNSRAKVARKKSARKQAAARSATRANKRSAKSKSKSVPNKRGAIQGNAITTPKKDNSAMIMLIVAGSLTLAAIVGAFIYVSDTRTESAKKASAIAEQYFSSNPGKYDIAVRKFQQAFEEAKGTSMEDSARARLQAVRRESEQQRQLINNYNTSKLRVRKLVDSKQYAKAIDLVNNLVRDIKDPTMHRQAQMTVTAIKDKMQEKSKKQGSQKKPKNRADD